MTNKYQKQNSACRPISAPRQAIFHWLGNSKDPATLGGPHMFAWRKPMMTKAKSLLKDIAYRSGVLGSYHRLRNSAFLTVAMFHRVLPTSDLRYAGADPEWTMTPESFSRCLTFFRKHYHVVSPDQVFSALRGEAALPECSLLVTFDDGWADTAEYAQPILDALSVSALIFVAGEAVNQYMPFWEERVYSYLATHPQAVAHLHAVLDRSGIHLAPASPSDTSEQRIRNIIKQMSTCDKSLLEAVTSTLMVSYRMPPAMLDTAGLLYLLAGSHTIGAHGMTHRPLTEVPDVLDELIGAKEKISAHLNDRAVETMSFPHGAYSDSIIAQCQSAGYKYLFSSDPYLNDFGTASEAPRPIARIHISERAVMDQRGKFKPAMLATWLFLRASTRSSRTDRTSDG